MIILKVAQSDWRKVEEYLLHQGVWYSDMSSLSRVFFIAGAQVKLIHIPDDKHASYLMMKYKVVNFTKEYKQLSQYVIDIDF